MALNRDRDDTTRAALGRSRGGGNDNPGIAVVVVGGVGIPTTAGPAQYSCQPVKVLGAEQEGGAVTTVSGEAVDPVVVTVFGRAYAGDVLVARRSAGRWYAERHAAGTIVDDIATPSCPCNRSPVTLTMTSSQPNSNSRMFQNATIQFRATPAGLLPLGLPPNAYFSTVSFPDGVTGDPFFYYLQCYQGAYVLTRLYEFSIYGSPFRDIIRYRWFVGLPGNICSPFGLTNGQIFSGGDASCVVTITS